VLPSVLAAFRKRYPEASLHLEVGNTDQVLGWVREGRVPLGAVEGSTRAPGLRLEPYLADDLVPVRSKDAFASVREVEDLVAVPLIWRETGSGTRTIIEKALRKADPRLVPRETDLIIGHTESIKAAVIEGLGIGFLSRWSIREELRRGALTIIPLPGLRIHRTFSWVQPAGGASGLSQVFLRFAQQNPPAL
jgi:DNA-binding transcriptional LysR family regulator